MTAWEFVGGRERTNYESMVRKFEGYTILAGKLRGNMIWGPHKDPRKLFPCGAMKRRHSILSCERPISRKPGPMPRAMSSILVLPHLRAYSTRAARRLRSVPTSLSQSSSQSINRQRASLRPASSQCKTWAHVSISLLQL